MSVNFGGISTVVKEILSIAKKVKNNEIVEKVIDLQELLLDAREENDNLKQEIKNLNDKIESLEQSNVLEDNLIFSSRGFCIKKNIENRIPYCSHCWHTNHKLIPLSQYRNWWEYKCGECNLNIVVMDKNGNNINDFPKGDL